MLRRRFSIAAIPLLVTCTVVLLTSIAALAVFQYRSGLVEPSEWKRETDTLLAEKLAQHEAHLTALAAVVRMSPEGPSATIQGLVSSITGFYTRITDIATVSTEQRRMSSNTGDRTAHYRKRPCGG